MVKRIVGGLMLLLGTALGLWIGYNFLVERVPSTKLRSPLGALCFTAGLLYVGVKWVRGKSTG
jgi:hypothetical protein